METPSLPSKALRITNQNEPNHNDNLHTYSTEMQVDASQPGLGCPIDSLASLLDTLVLPDTVVHDSVKYSLNLPSNLPDIDARRHE